MRDQFQCTWIYNSKKAIILHSGKWAEVASMNEKRYGLAMVATDGKLFIFGGVDTTGEKRVLSSVECYDPSRNRWEIITQMPTARWGLAAAELNGQIYVCGGWNEGHLSVCERYDYRKDQWETVAPMNKKRDRFSLVATDGRLYAIGGPEDVEVKGPGPVEMYDPGKNEWTLLPQTLKGRFRCSAVAI